jgi:hypothetical protein
MIRIEFVLLVVFIFGCDSRKKWDTTDRTLKLSYKGSDIWLLEQYWQDSSELSLMTAADISFDAELNHADSIDWLMLHKQNGQLFYDYLDSNAGYYSQRYLQILKNDTIFFETKSNPFRRNVKNTKNSNILFYQFEKCLFEMEICNDGWIIYYLMEGTDTTLFNEAKKSIEIIETPRRDFVSAQKQLQVQGLE